MLNTNQYSVTDYKRSPSAQATFPGLYFKFDIEPLTMTVTKRSVSFVAFLIRITSVLGGAWVCAQLAVRISARLMVVYHRYARGAALNIMKPPSTPNTFDTPHMSRDTTLSTPADTYDANPSDVYSVSTHSTDVYKTETPDFVVRSSKRSSKYRPAY